MSSRSESVSIVLLALLVIFAMSFSPGGVCETASTHRGPNTRRRLCVLGFANEKPPGVIPRGSSAITLLLLGSPLPERHPDGQHRGHHGNHVGNQTYRIGHVVPLRVRSGFWSSLLSTVWTPASAAVRLRAC